MSRSYVKRRPFLASRSRKKYKKILNKEDKCHNKNVLRQHIADLDSDYSYCKNKGELAWILDTFSIYESFLEYRRSYMYIHGYKECEMTKELETQIKNEWKKDYTK